MGTRKTTTEEKGITPPNRTKQRSPHRKNKMVRKKARLCHCDRRREVRKRTATPKEEKLESFSSRTNTPLCWTYHKHQRRE
jgi:hypothetical protein